MLKLTFKQTQAEMMVRAAATIIFNTLSKAGYPLIPLSEMAEQPQYGFTASASSEPVGLKFVRITDLQDGGINWDTVPYCKCDTPENYLLAHNDILFARTGATTGKTHLVNQAPDAVFASYLIRVRPKNPEYSEYLYSFFQSDAYWSQILDEKKGSAQPNVNGRKLISIQIPMVDSKMQSAISKFLQVVRRRQDGSCEELPELPPPLEKQRRIVARVEELARKIEEARSLRQEALDEIEALLGSELNALFNRAKSKQIEFRSIGSFTVYERYGPRFYNEAYSEYGVPIMRATDMDDRGRVNYDSMPKMLVSPEDREKLSLKSGDLVVVRSGSVGRAAVFDRTDIDCIPSAYMIQFRFEESVVPNYVRYYFQSPFVKDELNGRGTALKNINAQKIKLVKIPVPSLPEQHRIVAYLDNLQAKVDEMKGVREQAIQELDALLPSILDKAFKGEL